MTRKSIIERENKKQFLVNKHFAQRRALKEVIKSSKDFDEVEAAQVKLAKLPKNSNPARHTRRCQQCGRPHAVYRKFALCRICLRQELMNGNVTGGRKSSW